MTGRCERCLKRLTAEDQIVEYRSLSDTPDRGGRQRIFVTRFHPECDAARLREFQESQARAKIQEEEDRAAMLAAIQAASNQEPVGIQPLRK